MNGEYYHDPTAEEAIINILKKEKVKHNKYCKYIRTRTWRKEEDNVPEIRPEKCKSKQI